MLGPSVFWTFQGINSISALGMVVSPKHFHESLFPDPPRACKTLGFSETAVEMVHNVIRGQGAALLSISAFLFTLGPTDKASFLLIAFTCGSAALAHLLTMQHHRKSETVMKAVGSITPLYGMIALNLAIACSAAYLYSGYSSWILLFFWNLNWRNSWTNCLNKRTWFSRALQLWV